MKIFQFRSRLFGKISTPNLHSPFPLMLEEAKIKLKILKTQINSKRLTKQLDIYKKFTRTDS